MSPLETIITAVRDALPATPWTYALTESEFGAIVRVRREQTGAGAPASAIRYAPDPRIGQAQYATENKTGQKTLIISAAWAAANYQLAVRTMLFGMLQQIGLSPTPDDLDIPEWGRRAYEARADHQARSNA